MYRNCSRHFQTFLNISKRILENFRERLSSCRLSLIPLVPFIEACNSFPLACFAVARAPDLFNRHLGHFAPRVAPKRANRKFHISIAKPGTKTRNCRCFRICSNLFGLWIFCFPLKFRFAIESDSKNSFSRSRCIGSEPGIHENLAQLEMSTIRNELSVRKNNRNNHTKQHS